MFERFSLENKPWFRKKIFGLLLLIVAGVAVLEIWMVNRLATFGEQLADLEQVKGSLVLENELLENEIAEKSSLSHLREKAIEEGYVSIKNIQVVSND